MKITILSYGSRGDIQPFLALSKGLQKAGHQVCLAAPQRFEGFIERHAIPFAPFAGDPAEISALINHAGSNVYRMISSMRDYLLTIAPQVVDQMIQAATGADLLIHSFLFTTGGHTLARHLQIPDISIQTFPTFAPTGDYPNVAFPPLGRVGNYFSHWFASQVFWWGGNSGFRGIQRRMPAAFPRTLRWPFSEKHPTPLLYAISPSVIPPSADWPQPVHLTGYFFLDEDDYQPTGELLRFLQAGTPPVCVSFGSMVHREAERIGRILLEAFARTHQRAIILTGWGGWRPDSAPENIFYSESIPHSWLFPRCKIVVHHGGAGTTAAGLRAGIPNLVVPHAADQPFWGHRVHTLGVGPRPIPVQKLTVERFLAALAQAELPAVLAAAQAIGRLIHSEDGVRAAIRLIEQEKALFS